MKLPKRSEIRFPPAIKVLVADDERNPMLCCPPAFGDVKNIGFILLIIYIRAFVKIFLSGFIV